jgi:hypothetical protein
MTIQFGNPAIPEPSGSRTGGFASPPYDGFAHFRRGNVAVSESCDNRRGMVTDKGCAAGAMRVTVFVKPPRELSNIF